MGSLKRSWKVRVGSGTYEWSTKRSVTYRSDERLDRVRIARIVREFTLPAPFRQLRTVMTRARVTAREKRTVGKRARAAFPHT